MNFDEKKEEVVNCYSKTFDKDTAYKKAKITDQERLILEEDQDFQDRLEYFLIAEREKLIVNLKTFMDSDDDKIAYKATQDYINIIHPDFLKPLDKPKDVNVSFNTGKNTPEEDQRIAEEYGELLQDPGKFVKSQMESDEEEDE